MIDALHLIWIIPVAIGFGALCMAVLMAGFASWVVLEDEREDEDD